MSEQPPDVGVYVLRQSLDRLSRCVEGLFGDVGDLQDRMHALENPVPMSEPESPAEWRRLVDDHRMLPTDTPIVSLLRFASWLPDPDLDDERALVNIINICEQQTGIPADPDPMDPNGANDPDRYWWFNSAEDYNVGPLLYALRRTPQPCKDGETWIDWRSAGDYAAAWLHSIVDGDGDGASEFALDQTRNALHVAFTIIANAGNCLGEGNRDTTLSEEWYDAAQRFLRDYNDNLNIYVGSREGSDE